MLYSILFPLIAMNDIARRGASPKDVFLHLLAIGTLYVSFVNLLVLLFQYINHLFPDVLTYGYGGADLSGIRFADAALIIVFPVFLLVSWLIARDIRLSPDRAEVWVRKWLLYLTIFLAAIVSITDLVVLVFYFLNGDLTGRFLLKVLTVFLVSAAVFAYELWELRRTNPSTSAKTQKIWAIASTAVVALSVIGGFFIIGSPFAQRQVRFDERRVSDLQTIQNEIVSYWQAKNLLPSKLDALTNTISGFTPPTDPDTAKPYEYRTTGTLSFELCSTFATSQPAVTTTPRAPYSDPYGQNWNHGEGRVCFSRTIDPDLYRKQGTPFK